jgi:hypothetical protein
VGMMEERLGNEGFELEDLRGVWEWVRRRSTSGSC